MFGLLLVILIFQFEPGASINFRTMSQKVDSYRNGTLPTCSGINNPGYGCHFHCPEGTIRVYDRTCEKFFLRCCYFPLGPCHGKDHFCVAKCPSHWIGFVTQSCPYYNKPKCCIRQYYEPRPLKLQLIDWNSKWLHKLFPYWFR